MAVVNYLCAQAYLRQARNRLFVARCMIYTRQDMIAVVKCESEACTQVFFAGTPDNWYHGMCYVCLVKPYPRFVDLRCLLFRLYY